jgi:hypothetical protein
VDVVGIAEDRDVWDSAGTERAACAIPTSLAFNDRPDSARAGWTTRVTSLSLR